MQKGVFNLDRSVKAILAGVIALATTLATGYDDSVLTGSEKALAVGAAITAMGGVWAFSNVYAKAGISAAVAAATALAAGLADDALSAQEWITVITAAVVAFAAVYKTPNVEDTPAPTTTTST